MASTPEKSHDEEDDADELSRKIKVAQEVLARKKIDKSLEEISKLLHRLALSVKDILEARASLRDSNKLSIAEFNLSRRARNGLMRKGIYNFPDLIEWTARDLLSDNRNFGLSSLKEVRRELGRIHLKLKYDTGNEEGYGTELGQ